MKRTGLINPFSAPAENDNISIEEVKYIGYGVFMPIIILILAHSVLAVAAVQLLVFLIQKSIDKKRAVATLKLAAFTAAICIVALVFSVLSAGF